MHRRHQIGGRHPRLQSGAVKGVVPGGDIHGPARPHDPMGGFCQREKQGTPMSLEIVPETRTKAAFVTGDLLVRIRFCRVGLLKKENRKERLWIRRERLRLRTGSYSSTLFPQAVRNTFCQLAVSKSPEMCFDSFWLVPLVYKQ